MDKIAAIRKEREFIKGRPSLPPVLKSYIKEKHINTVRENMRTRYKKIAIFDTIKDSLLTPQEIEIIEDMFEDKNNPILSKIKKLYAR